MIDIRGVAATDLVQDRNAEFAEAHVVDQEVADAGALSAIALADLGKLLIAFLVFRSPLVRILVQKHIVLRIVLNSPGTRCCR